MKTHSENMKMFWRYIAERHAIYKKKNIEKLPPPWTTDPILWEYKFTNVFRDLDPGTRYVIDSIIPKANMSSSDLIGGSRKPADKNNPGFPLSREWQIEGNWLQNLLFNLIIYRLYNKPITSDAVGWQEIGKFDRKIFEKKLRDLKNTGEKVFTNAYLVSGYEQYSNYGDKIARTGKLLEDIAERIPEVIERIISASLSFPRRFPEGNPLVGRESSQAGHISWIPDQVGDDKNDEFLISQNTYEATHSLPGLGEFLAYQIAVDLGYAHPDLYDESIHVVAGPGCKRGIDRLFVDKGGLSYEDAIFWLVDHQEEWFASVWVDPDVLFADRKIPRLNLMAIENCLCEISKYLKVKYGEGRPRNRYKLRMKN